MSIPRRRHGEKEIVEAGRFSWQTKFHRTHSVILRCAMSSTRDEAGKRCILRRSRTCAMWLSFQLGHERKRIRLAVAFRSPRDVGTVDTLSMTPAEIIDDVMAIATGAGEIILRHFAAPIPTSLKSSRIDIVTAADTEAETYIVGELNRRFPHHHIVGEEGGGQGASAEAAPYHWFVDPIDGTVNFASKLPHFCTSIALATPDRQPLLAVIYDATRREMFTATRGGGAFLNGEGLEVTSTAELVDSVISSGFPYDKHSNADNNLKEWSAFLTKIRGERRLGSAALDLAYVAAGRLDGYWEKDLKTYDVMAGLLMVREAGGTVTDYRGGQHPQREERGRYVASNGRIHPAMLQVLASVR
jgi:myo-inositol-1(or 4)-monophosphatase